MKNRHAAALGKKGGKIGGLSRSPAKTAAARANGRKGGRPKKSIKHAWNENLKA
jgi:general stress protein YciG